MKPTVKELKKEIKSLEELNASLEGLINHFEAIGLNQLNKIQELEHENALFKQVIEMNGKSGRKNRRVISEQRIEIRVYRELLELPRCPRHA